MTHFYLWASIITTVLVVILPFVSDEFFGRRILVPHYDYAARHDFNIPAKIIYNSMAAECVHFAFRLLWKLGLKIGLPYAFTIWRRIYIRSGMYSTTPKVIMHEYEHVRQWYDLGVLGAPWQYLQELVVFGYLQAPLEVSARMQAGQRMPQR